MTDHQQESVTVKLTAADYAKFNLYHGRWQLTGLFLFYCVLFVILFTYAGFLGGNVGLVPAVFLSIVMSGLFLLFQIWRIRTKTVRLFENGHLSGLEQKIRLSGDGMHHTAGDHTAHVSWGDFYKAVETKEAITLYLARNKVVLLPKRDLSDRGAGVKAMLRKHLPAAKLRLKN